MGRAEGLRDLLKASELGSESRNGHAYQRQSGSRIDREKSATCSTRRTNSTCSGSWRRSPACSESWWASANSRSAPPRPRPYFSLLLVVFLFAAALTYLGALQDRDVASFDLAVLRHFSALLGFAVGLAAASLLPVDVQFGGFWVIAIVAALSFNWTLQRWHRKLDWGPVLVGRLWGGWVRSTGD